MAKHWTEGSIEKFVNRLSFDFITQLAKKLESLPLSRGKFAEKLNLTTGRVSQIFNDPGNLTLRKIVKYAKAVGMNVAIVAYDDDNPNNERGHINSEIFAACWERAGRPVDFFSLNTRAETAPIEIMISSLRTFNRECGFGIDEWYTAFTEPRVNPRRDNSVDYKPWELPNA